MLYTKLAMRKPIKELGQNFLLEKDIALAMVDSLGVKQGEVVVEIGPGRGIITQILVEKINREKIQVKAVEIDKNLVELLNRKYSHTSGLEIIEDNILDWLPNFIPEKRYKIIGSLPYYITSPILHKIIQQGENISTAVLMLQKEVAEKIVQDAPQASYLSTYLKTFYQLELMREVPRSFFEPQPKVDGAIIRMERLSTPLIESSEMENYEDFLHLGFSKPRKMLNKTFSKEMLNEIGIDETLRPQHVSVEKWIELFRIRKTSSLK